MARKVDKTAASTAEPSSAVGDLSVLNPDVKLTVAGRALTVREYGFWEGLEVAHRATEFIADMLAMCADGTLRYTTVRRLFGVHRDVVQALVAQSADVELAWVAGLKGAEAERLLSTWFAVNAGFFLREAAVETEEVRYRAAAAARKQKTSPTSSSASPTPDSGTTKPLADSPSES